MCRSREGEKGGVMFRMLTIGSLFFLLMWPIVGFDDAVMGLARLSLGASARRQCDSALDHVSRGEIASIGLDTIDACISGFFWRVGCSHRRSAGCHRRHLA